MSLLELARVSKRFSRGSATIVALDDLSLALDPGDFVAIWGGRSSGKTSLLRVAAGIEAPDAGRVRYDGREVATLSRRARAALLLSEIGCVWHSVAAPRGLTITDHVMLPLLRSSDPRNARERAQEALRTAGVPDCGRATWHELASGERARVAIAHALVRRPRLVLADEPTANLNLVEREEVLALLRAAAEEHGAAVLMTAPDAPDTLQSHRLASIDRGKLIEPRRGNRGTVVDFPGAARRATEQGA